jgi:hypothetical protein
MSRTPPAGQGPFFRGERLTAAKLNELAAARPVRVFGQGHVEGETVLVDQPETMWIRLTDVDSSNSPPKYAWKRVSRLANGTWQNLTHTGNTSNDYAVEINNESCPVNTTSVFRAYRSLTTGEWLFGKGSGQTEFRGKDVLTMILGPWENYKDCEGAPPDPPVATDENCPPAYAWAGYKPCGYRFKKVSHFLSTDEAAETPGDIPIVGMGFWATELNGGSTTSWRRFHRSWWGWDTESSSVTDPDIGCAGVRFESPGLSPITCSCPPWLQNVNCFKLRIKYVADPGPPPPCDDEPDPDPTPDPPGPDAETDFGTLSDSSDPCCDPCYEKMEGFFGEEVVVTLCNQEMGCLWQGDGPAPFAAITATYQNLYETDPCFTGPDWFDPCNPCDGFGVLSFGISDPTLASGGCGNPSQFYVGGRVTNLSALKRFVDACAANQNPDPIRLVQIVKGSPCPNYIEWMQLECCTCLESNVNCGTEIDCEVHDSASSLPDTLQDNDSGPTIQDGDL